MPETQQSLLQKPFSLMRLGWCMAETNHMLGRRDICFIATVICTAAGITDPAKINQKIKSLAEASGKQDGSFTSLFNGLLIVVEGIAETGKREIVFYRKSVVGGKTTLELDGDRLVGLINSKRGDRATEATAQVAYQALGGEAKDPEVIREKAESLRKKGGRPKSKPSESAPSGNAIDVEASESAAEPEPDIAVE